MTRSGWWALVLVAGLAAGCGGEGEPPATDFADALEVRLDEMEESEGGLHWRTLEAGEGATAEPGDTAVVHYTGWLPDGTKFDSSRDRGEPLRFVVGAGQVIAGWDEGVAGMEEGETRQLVIPPALGYGERGAGNVIPPNATLVFEVELLEVGAPDGG